MELAEGTFKKVKAEVQNRVRQDAQQEIAFMATLMKRAFIGIAGGKSAPNGTIVMSKPMSSYSRPAGIRPATSAGTNIAWAPRGDRYMNWKESMGFGSKWFLNNGAILPAFVGRASNWTGRFGGVEVTVTRSGGAGGASSLGTLSTQSRNVSKGGRVTYGDGKIVQQVCNIRVGAMGRITPQMLPGLRNGELGGPYPDGRDSGLIDALPAEVRFRLGGRGKKYRHTIEPFLTFVLTQAIPNALFLRVQQGLQSGPLQKGAIFR